MALCSVIWISNNTQVTKKAREIYSQHISLTSDSFIGCKHQISHNIEKELSPPYEELFDEGEVYALEVLLQAWMSMVVMDRQLLEQVISAFIQGDSSYLC